MQVPTTFTRSRVSHGQNSLAFVALAVQYNIQYFMILLIIIIVNSSCSISSRSSSTGVVLVYSFKVVQDF